MAKTDTMRRTTDRIGRLAAPADIAEMSPRVAKEKSQAVTNTGAGACLSAIDADERSAGPQEYRTPPALPNLLL